MTNTKRRVPESTTTQPQREKKGSALTITLRRDNRKQQWNDYFYGKRSVGINNYYFEYFFHWLQKKEYHDIDTKKCVTTDLTQPFKPIGVPADGKYVNTISIGLYSAMGDNPSGIKCHVYSVEEKEWGFMCIINNSSHQICRGLVKNGLVCNVFRCQCLGEAYPNQTITHL